MTSLSEGMSASLVVSLRVTRQPGLSRPGERRTCGSMGQSPGAEEPAFAARARRKDPVSTFYYV